MSQFELGTDFRAWAFSITRYKVMEHRRKLKKDQCLVFNNDLSTLLADETNVDNHDHNELHDTLELCISQLRPKDQALIRHRYAREENLSEFAEKTEQSVGALRVTLHRLRFALRRCITQRLKWENLS